jgi:hypothetical protein
MCVRGGSERAGYQQVVFECVCVFARVRKHHWKQHYYHCAVALSLSDLCTALCAQSAPNAKYIYSEADVYNCKGRIVAACAAWGNGEINACITSLIVRRSRWIDFLCCCGRFFVSRVSQ